MNEQALKLFIENYTNQGICAELPKFVKTIEKKFKDGTIKEIKYFPWAIIERLFRMQGGKLEVVEWAKQVAVNYADYVVDETTGEVKMGLATAYPTFIHLKGTWQGEELEEFYPLFDSATSKIIKSPDGMDLNNARQRGGVRLIGRLSGIGLHIFEQSEEENDDIPKTEGDKVKVDVKPKKKVEKEEKVVTPPTPKIDPLEALVNETVKVEVVDDLPITAAPPLVKVAIAEEYDIDSVEHAELVLEIKRKVKEKGIRVREVLNYFNTNFGKDTLSQCSWGELKAIEHQFNL